jgi:hypothetical protein
MLVRPFGAGAERSTQGLAATLQVACRWWTSARRDHSLHALRARGSLAYAMRRWARRETSHSALDIFGRRAVERRRLAVSHARLLFSFEPVSPRGDDHPGFNNVPYPHALGVWVYALATLSPAPWLRSAVCGSRWLADLCRQSMVRKFASYPSYCLCHHTAVVAGLAEKNLKRAPQPRAGVNIAKQPAMLQRTGS